MKLLVSIIVGSLAFTLFGCKTLEGADAEPTYGSDALSNMKLGNEALKNKNYDEAEKYFEHIRTKFPYLDLSKQAELKLADTEFDREKWEEARDKYQNFVKIHPTHAQVDYAAYRAALTHYKQIPTDFFLVPPSSEKDQAPVRDAYKSLTDFTRQFPSSKYAAEAQKQIDDTRRRMAEHEMYVASFYAQQEHWGSVVGRLQTVVRDYAGLGFDEKALMGLYEAYTQMRDLPHAKEALQTLISRMPGTPAATKATKLLGS